MLGGWGDYSAAPLAALLVLSVFQARVSMFSDCIVFATRRFLLHLYLIVVSMRRVDVSLHLYLIAMSMRRVDSLENSMQALHYHSK